MIFVDVINSRNVNFVIKVLCLILRSLYYVIIEPLEFVTPPCVVKASVVPVVNASVVVPVVAVVIVWAEEEKAEDEEDWVVEVSFVEEDG